MISFKSSFIYLLVSAIWAAKEQHTHRQKRRKKLPSSENNFGICVITNEQDCSYEYLKTNLGKRKYWSVKPGGDSKCLDGSPYEFQVFPGENNRLMHWFQGGGACWSHYTCVASPTASRVFYPFKSGIFNIDLEGNPLVKGGWAIVVNNYCTGDLHTGNSASKVTSADGSETVTIFHNGYNNTKAVLKWIQKQPEFFPEQETVLGGDSAGTQIWAKMLVKDYGYDKIVLDSYIGYMPPESTIASHAWNICEVSRLLGISEKLIDQCKSGDLYTFPPIFEDFLKNNPTIPVSYIGSTQDQIQINYYALGTVPDYSGDTSELIPGLTFATSTFSRYQWDALTLYRNINENFSDYIIASEEHFFLSFDRIATDPSLNSPYSKQTMLQFFDNFLNYYVYDGSPNYPMDFPFSQVTRGPTPGPIRGPTPGPIVKGSKNGSKNGSKGPTPGPIRGPTPGPIVKGSKNGSYKKSKKAK